MMMMIIVVVVDDSVVIVAVHVVRTTRRIRMVCARTRCAAGKALAVRWVNQ